MEEKDNKLFYSPTEFRKILGCSKHLVYEALRQGKILSFRLGSRYFIPKSELTRLGQTAGENTVFPD